MAPFRRTFVMVLLVVAVQAFAARNDSQDSGRLLTLAASTGSVRLIAGGEIAGLRIEVHALDGTLLFDSGWRSGDVLDWAVSDAFGHRLAAGTYNLVATSRDLRGATITSNAAVHVTADQVRIDSDEMETVTEPASIVRLAHDGDEGRLVTTTGALSFRFGDFLAQRDVEAMRLTPDGNLDVAGVIHAGKGILFPDGTIQVTASRPNVFGFPAHAPAYRAEPAVGGTGTANQIAKWVDDLGNLGNSSIFDAGNGKVGIGTNTPAATFHVFGPPTNDVFAGLGPDPVNGPGMNYGYAGFSFGRGAGFFNVRPDSAATPPNPSLRFMTANLQRMIITNAGNIGIAKLDPSEKLEVAGNIKLAGAGNGFIFPDATKLSTLPVTAVTPGTGLTGGGTTGPVSLSIADGGVDTLQIHDNAVTAPKIANNQVVKSIDGLKNDVTITGVNGTSVTTVGSDIQISATPLFPKGAVIFGLGDDTTLINAGFTQIGSTTQQVWTSTSSNALSPRRFHTAVWTGTKMIIWGGGDTGGGPRFQDGAVYDPVTDTWTPTSVNAQTPVARELHTAVWTGTKMIVWGGQANGNVYQSTGGVYDPSDDSWTPTAAVPALAGRINHTAIWNGTYMVVWGGIDLASNRFNDGGRYRPPPQNDWQAVSTTNAPSARDLQTAVWTGTTMIIWGGRPNKNDGGRYDPNNDLWNAAVMSTTGAPAARFQHTAVTTGESMIIFGGTTGAGAENTGGIYDAAANSWTAIPATGLPRARKQHTAVMTPGGMVVWGGANELGAAENTGAILTTLTGPWVALETTNAPTARFAHTAVYTGSRMIVWGGENGTIRFASGGQWGFLSIYRKN